MSGNSFAFILILLSGTLALAESQERSRNLPVDEMVAKAEVVGVAVVQGSTVRQDPRNGMIYTDYSLKFGEVWKGTPSDPFLLTQAGGRIGDVAASIAGHEYTLEPGQKLVVFASLNLGRHVVIGIRHGLYRVGEGTDPRLTRLSEASASPLTLRQLKEQTYRIMGRSPDPVPPGGASTPAGVPSKNEDRSGGTPASPGTASTPHGNVPQADDSEFPWRTAAGAAILLLLAAAVAFRLLKKKLEAS